MSKFSKPWQHHVKARSFAVGTCIYLRGKGVPYPTMRVKGKQIGVARLVLAEKLKRPLKRGKFACHTCDDSRCINGRHLYEGNHRTNARDAVKRGQHVKGEKHANAKLTDAQVIKIKSAVTQSGKLLAKKYRVSMTTISLIRSGERWAHL